MGRKATWKEPMALKSPLNMNFSATCVQPVSHSLGFPGASALFLPASSPKSLSWLSRLCLPLWLCSLGSVLCFLGAPIPGHLPCSLSSQWYLLSPLLAELRQASLSVAACISRDACRRLCCGNRLPPKFSSLNSLLITYDWSRSCHTNVWCWGFCSLHSLGNPGERGSVLCHFYCHQSRWRGTQWIIHWFF